MKEISKLIPIKRNLFSKLWIKIKTFFYKNDKKLLANELKNDENIANIKNDEFQVIQEKYEYVKDIDYDKEKEYVTKLTKDIIENKKDLRDLDLADIVRIKLMIE